MKAKNCTASCSTVLQWCFVLAGNTFFKSSFWVFSGLYWLSDVIVEDRQEVSRERETWKGWQRSRAGNRTRVGHIVGECPTVSATVGQPFVISDSGCTCRSTQAFASTLFRRITTFSYQT